MKQKATVIELKGKSAVISVRRASMCEGCEKSGDCASACLAGELMGANKTMTAVASNEIGAKVGDVVEIESESRTVLGYAALIFIFPIIVCATGYGIGKHFGSSDAGAMLCAGVGFIAAFAAIICIDRIKKRKEKPDIKIIGIVES